MHNIMQPNRHLDLEKKQVKKLLTEFRKAKMSCLQVCEQANKEMPNLQHYQILEVTCTRKMDSLDLFSIIKLKQQLAASTTSVCELQKQLTSNLFKHTFQKIVKPKLEVKDTPIHQQTGPFHIPEYQSRSENNENKVQRLSSYIITLGRSMSALRRCILGDWKVEDFYKYQPEYLQIQRRLQQFRMRDQQLVHIIQKQFKLQLKKLSEKGQRIEGQDEYDVVKIPRNMIQNYGKQQFKNKPFGELQMGYHPHSMIDPRRNKNAMKKKKKSLQKISQEQQQIQSQNNHYLTKVSSEVNLDINGASFNKNNKTDLSSFEQNGQSDNYVYMVKRVGAENQFNSSVLSSISSLRSLRKRVFDDDIWDQFQKI